MPWIDLALRLRPEAGDAPPLIICVELELEAYRIVDAAYETHGRMDRLHVERLQQMSTWRKLALMAEMTESVRTLALTMPRAWL